MHGVTALAAGEAIGEQAGGDCRVVMPTSEPGCYEQVRGARRVRADVGQLVQGRSKLAKGEMIEAPRND
jgi:hypothetical protein